MVSISTASAFSHLGEHDGIGLSFPGRREPNAWARSRNGVSEKGQLEAIVLEHDRGHIGGHTLEAVDCDSLLGPPSTLMATAASMMTNR